MRFRSRQAVCIVVSGVSALAWAQEAVRPALVREAPVVERMVEQKRQATGDVRALRRSQLAAEEGGLVLEMDVDAGSAVEAGQRIAHLDPTRVELDLAQAQARVQSARALIQQRQAEADQAERDLARVRKMLEAESGSQPELDRAQSAAAVARAQLAQAQAELALSEAEVKLIEKRLSDLDIRAPFAGRVVQKMTEVGQWVHSGDPVVELVELDRVEIRINVPEAYVQRAAQAESVSVHLPGLGREIEAKVLAVVPQADPLSRLFPVRLIAENPEGEIKPGMSAIGLVPTSVQAESMLVPKDAILTSETGPYVYYDNQGVAALATVERLFAVGEEVAVRSPVLQAGMKVIVEGNERLFPGQPLNILPGGSSGETGSKD